MCALKGKETKTDRKKTAKEVKKWLEESQTDMNVEVVSSWWTGFY